MGSLVSPILANIYIEWLEGEAIATAPIDCRPKTWKRYVDNVLEVMKQGQVGNLTQHLNTIDTMDNNKFTHEPEVQGKIPFLDILITKREDGTVELCVYRKKTHTDQSHHPLHHKLGVVRTLLDRCNNIVTDPADMEEEENHIAKALKQCGYPKWTVKRVKKDIELKKQQTQTQRAQQKHKNKETRSKCMYGGATLY